MCIHWAWDGCVGEGELRSGKGTDINHYRDRTEYEMVSPAVLQVRTWWFFWQLQVCCSLSAQPQTCQQSATQYTYLRTRWYSRRTRPRGWRWESWKCPCWGRNHSITSSSLENENCQKDWFQAITSKASILGCESPRKNRHRKNLRSSMIRTISIPISTSTYKHEICIWNHLISLGQNIRFYWLSSMFCFPVPISFGS